MLAINLTDSPIPPTPTLRVRNPQGRIVTQTIERVATTYTTHVTLGLGPNATLMPEATDSTTAAAVAPLAAPPAGTVNTTPGYDYIGAIVGSVVAFVFLLLLLWFCLFRPRMLRQRRLAARQRDEDSDGYDSWSRSRTPPPRPQWQQRPRGPPPPVLNPAPVRIKPMRYTGWTHSAEPQMRGMRVFP